MALWNKIFGSVLDSFPPDIVPSKRDVLRVFFNFQNQKKITISTAATKTSQLLRAHWLGLNRNAMQLQKICPKIIALNNQFRSLRKSATRGGDRHAENISQYERDISLVFDIGGAYTDTPPRRAAKRRAAAEAGLASKSRRRRALQQKLDLQSSAEGKGERSGWSSCQDVCLSGVDPRDVRRVRRVFLTHTGTGRVSCRGCLRFGRSPNFHEK